MRFLFITFFSIFLFACSSDSTDKKSAIKKPEELSNNTEEIHLKPKQANESLDKLLNQIWELPKVQERSEYVQKETKGERKLKIEIQQEPTKADPYYWVKVGEDNGMSFVSHFLFAIDPNTNEIFYYDSLTGEKMTVEEWGKVEEMPIE